MLVTIKAFKIKSIKPTNKQTVRESIFSSDVTIISQLKYTLMNLKFSRVTVCSDKFKCVVTS